LTRSGKDVGKFFFNPNLKTEVKEVPISNKYYQNMGKSQKLLVFIAKREHFGLTRLKFKFQCKV
jgi:hypothetical protein